MAVRDIIKIFNPTIQLDEISISDAETGTDEFKTTDSRFKLSNYMGTTAPTAVVNGMNFDKSMIESCIIDLSDFLPKLSIVLKDVGGALTSKYYPMDGDLINIYLKTKNKDYKPLRLDFSILSMRSFADRSSDSGGSVYAIEGILRVPEFYVDKCVSFTDSDSFTVMKSVAKQLQLGFASNDTKTNDKMSWICPFDTYKKFCMDVMTHAYKDDESFYTAFVDEHYIMNFVEVNSMFVTDRDVDIASTHKTSTTDYSQGDTDIEKSETRLVLTNSKTENDTPNFIESYTLINNSGNIAFANGYRRYLHYYDKVNSIFVENFVDTLNSDGASDYKLLRGREDEDYKTRLKYKFMGVQSENVHQNYLYAKVQNFQNLQEMEKICLLVNLQEYNPALYRYQSIPVSIYNYYNEAKSSMLQGDGSTENTASLDLLLTGWYVIKDMKLIYDKAQNRTVQQLVLTRREWSKTPNI